jgi:hypothetical protein
MPLAAPVTIATCRCAAISLSSTFGSAKSAPTFPPAPAARNAVSPGARPYRPTEH